MAYLWSRAADPVAAAIVAHGAGAGMRHPFMAGVAEGLTAHRVSALRFDFPYVEQGRRAPDRPPVLLESWRGALAEAAHRAEGVPLVASGKSLGGRMASMLAAEARSAFPAVALVFFGYPLHAPGRPELMRDAHLTSITVPMLFIQGTRDALARFDLIQSVVAGLGDRARLHAVEGGDHSFRVPGRKRPDAEIAAELASVAAAFILEKVG